MRDNTSLKAATCMKRSRTQSDDPTIRHPACPPRTAARSPATLEGTASAGDVAGGRGGGGDHDRRHHRPVQQAAPAGNATSVRPTSSRHRGRDAATTGRKVSEDPILAALALLDAGQTILEAGQEKLRIDVVAFEGTVHAALETQNKLLLDLEKRVADLKERLRGYRRLEAQAE